MTLLTHILLFRCQTGAFVNKISLCYHAKVSVGLHNLQRRQEPELVGVDKPLLACYVPPSSAVATYPTDLYTCATVLAADWRKREARTFPSKLLLDMLLSQSQRLRLVGKCTCFYLCHSATSRCILPSVHKIGTEPLECRGTGNTPQR